MYSISGLYSPVEYTVLIIFHFFPVPVRSFSDRSVSSVFATAVFLSLLVVPSLFTVSLPPMLETFSSSASIFFISSPFLYPIAFVPLEFPSFAVGLSDFDVSGLRERIGIILATMSSDLTIRSTTILAISIYGFCVSNIDVSMVFSVALRPVMSNALDGCISLFGIFILPAEFLYLLMSPISSLFTSANFRATISLFAADGEFMLVNRELDIMPCAMPTSPFTKDLKKSKFGINSKAGCVPLTDLDIELGLPGSASDTCEGPCSIFSLYNGQKPII